MPAATPSLATFPAELLERDEAVIEPDAPVTVQVRPRFVAIITFVRSDSEEDVQRVAQAHKAVIGNVCALRGWRRRRCLARRRRRRSEEAKTKIGDAILARLARVLGKDRVKRLFFIDFVVQ